MLIPVIVALILSENRTAAYVAAIVFFAAAVTDRLDGYVARRFQSTTRLGQWLDPLADKLLISAPVLTLTALGRFPVWAAAVIVAREVLVSLLRAWLGTRGRSLPASDWGKVKTAAQVLAIFLYLVPFGSEAEDARFVALVLAVVLTVWSGVDYLVGMDRHARRGS